MRIAFIRTLCEIAKVDKRVFLLSVDLGYTVLEEFAKVFPDRYLNVGVAEQNLVGIATGLAEAGYIPFVYSIVTFATLRAYEFIRNGPIAHQLPVRIIGVGGGMEYSHNGLTHWGLEDMAVMRVQPGLSVIAPADPLQAATALKQTWDLKGPIYYRLGKDETSTVDGLHGRFKLSGVEEVATGSDLLLLTTGAISQEVTRAAKVLYANGINATVVVVSTLNPAPLDELRHYLSRFSRVFTIEAHYVTGGLGSLACEIVAQYGLACRVERCGVDHLPDGRTGGQAYLQDQAGISA